MASKSLFGLVSLVLLAGGIIFMFFILLAGAVQHYPVNRFYFLEADTSNIPTAPTVARWTYWNVCGKDGARTVCDGSEHSYEKVHPAYPLDPPSHRTFDTHDNVPSQFIGTSYYFYMTRFMFAFMLMALFFAVVAFFVSILALCTRLGAYLASFFSALAFFFQAIQVSLMTAAYVKGRNAFRSNSQSAHVGAYAIGFEWAALVCFLLSVIFLCLGGSSGRGQKRTKRAKGGQSAAPPASSPRAPRKPFFRAKRTKSTRSRGSFIDGADKEFS